jgi:hypothetical protein
MIIIFETTKPDVVKITYFLCITKNFVKGLLYFFRIVVIPNATFARRIVQWSSDSFDVLH